MREVNLIFQDKSVWRRRQNTLKVWECTLICRHEQKLTERFLAELAEIDHVTIYGPENIRNRIGVVSFTMDKIHPHEIAFMLDEKAAILVRSGDHCCIPLMRYFGLENGTVRASLYLYNTLEEIDLLIGRIE